MSTKVTVDGKDVLLVSKNKRIKEYLCEKALLADLFYNGLRQYVKPQPMEGFIEFKLMRTRDDIDQKHLSELYSL